MGYLNSKSQFNLFAAKILIEQEDCYAPSVHCSYYGCFQYIKSKLNSLGYTYDQVDKDIVSSKAEGRVKLSTHGYPIDLLYKELKAKTTDSGIFASKIKSDIKKLKLFREESDYYNVEVNHQKAKGALDLSQEIITSIKKVL